MHRRTSRGMLGIGAQLEIWCLRTVCLARWGKYLDTLHRRGMEHFGTWVGIFGKANHMGNYFWLEFEELGG